MKDESKRILFKKQNHNLLWTYKTVGANVNDSWLETNSSSIKTNIRLNINYRSHTPTRRFTLYEKHSGHLTHSSASTTHVDGLDNPFRENA